jgi:hypothetical protein
MASSFRALPQDLSSRSSNEAHSKCSSRVAQDKLSEESPSGHTAKRFFVVPRGGTPQNDNRKEPIDCEWNRAEGNNNNFRQNLVG